MELYYHRRFKKQYRKLAPQLQQKVDHTIRLFEKNHHDSHLRNHALSGTFQGERAISVTGDMRIIFREENDYQRVTLLRVGTHNQVYK